MFLQDQYKKIANSPFGDYVWKKTVGATGAVIMNTPLFGAYEKFLAHQATDVSLKSRFGFAAVTYILAPLAYKGRDISKKHFGITEQSTAWQKIKHDGLFGATLGLVYKPIVYMASGETDLKKIVFLTLATSATSAILTPILMHVMDTFKDLTGVEEYALMPKCLKNKSRKFKRNLAITYAATSVALTALIYSTAPSYMKEHHSSLNVDDNRPAQILYVNQQPKYLEDLIKEQSK